MKTIKGIAVCTLAVVTLIGLGACATRGEDTAAGVGVGAVAGAVLLDSPLGLVAGAVVGGVVGHEADKDKP